MSQLCSKNVHLSVAALMGAGCQHCEKTSDRWRRKKQKIRAVLQRDVLALTTSSADEVS